ncbi:MAG TPA: hypothetical protein PLX69_21725 [Leptospiraceae bacterium]|nr:hypothetical protein [Leptospiraceae bacterium]
MEVLTKSLEDKWMFSESDDSGIIKLASIDCILQLNDVYDKVVVLEEQK